MSLFVWLVSLVLPPASDVKLFSGFDQQRIDLPASPLNLSHWITSYELVSPPKVDTSPHKVSV